jgi:hypothetical protein
MFQWQTGRDAGLSERLDRCVHNKYKIWYSYEGEIMEIPERLFVTEESEDDEMKIAGSDVFLFNVL